MSGAAPPVPAATRARVAVPFIVVTLIWGSTWLVIRDQLGVVPPTWSVTYRFLVAGAAMFAYVKLTGASLRLGRRGQGLAVAVGVCLFMLNFNFVYRAERHVTSGLVAVVFALLIVPNALLARLFYGQRLSRPFFAGSAVAMLGVALLFRHELASAEVGARAVAIGIGLTVVALSFASVANVLQAGRLAKSLPLASVLAWAMLWGTLGNAAFALVTVGPPVVDWRASYVLGILWLGLAGSTLAFPLYFQVIRAIGPARAAYSGVLVPIIAMALSTVFEGYRWSAEAAAGAALVMIGLVIALAARRPAPG